MVEEHQIHSHKTFSCKKPKFNLKEPLNNNTFLRFVDLNLFQDSGIWPSHSLRLECRIASYLESNSTFIEEKNIPI